MQVLYEPKGKAREYSPLAANIYTGCGHGCQYCYVPNYMHITQQKFTENPHPRQDIIKKLVNDLEKFKGIKKEVLLCFTCDPYQPINEIYGLTRKAIYMLNLNGFPVQILTKGGTRPIQDFDILAKNPSNSFSVTLTHDNPDISTQWEPHAAPPAERIEGLKQAKNHNIKTWVSFEPVIDPKAVYRLIDTTADFVDLYKVGKLNHHEFQNTIDWPKFRDQCIAKLKALHKKYYIKKDLLLAK